MSTGTLWNTASSTTSRSSAVVRADDRKRAALALANRTKAIQRASVDRQHIALLRLVAPDLARRHPGLFARYGAQVEAGAFVAAVDDLGQRVGQASRAHVMDRANRIGVAELPAAVDDFLRAALDLRIAALHRIEIEVCRVGAGCHRRCRAAAEADEHAGAADLHDQCAVRQRVLVRIARDDVADAAGDHDRLVISAHFTRNLLLEGAEIAEQIGAPEFVVERRGADRPVEHDRKR